MNARITISIPEELHQRLAAAKPKYQSLSGFYCELLDRGVTLGKPSTAQAVPPEGGEGFPSSSKAVTSKTSSKSLSMSLARHESEIREFWKVKKGSKGDTAWKLLMTELTKLQERYGDAVVEEQLQLAINGKWAGIRLSNYEQFKPKDAPKPKAKKLTPEEEKAKAERDHMERCRKWGLL